MHIVVVVVLSSHYCVRLFVNAPYQALLFSTVSWSLLKFMSTELVMTSNHLILCHPLLLLPTIFPSIRVLFNESALHIRWPNYWGFSFSTSPAAAAKWLQSCPTLCDPIDGSPPGSPIPGILQARTLEWVAISFSNAWKVKVKSLSRVQLLVTPWTAAYQAPLPMGFSRQEYWSGVPLPSPIRFIDVNNYYQSYYSLSHIYQNKIPTHKQSLPYTYPHNVSHSLTLTLCSPRQSLIYFLYP